MAFCAAALLASCAAGKKAAALSTLYGEWNITEINGKAVTAQAGPDSPFIGFNKAERLVYGSTGCNRLTGVLNIDEAKGTIDLSALGMTRMMCADMTTEQQVTDALPKIKSYRLGGGTLSLCDTYGNVVMTLDRRR